MDHEKTCCFTGHRPDKLPWGEDESDPRCLRLKRAIAQAVEDAYVSRYRRFITGMARGGDLYFAEAVLALREARGDVSLEAAVPCPTQADGWPEEDRARWRRLLEACDLETMVQDHYTPGCMLRRNRYMVDHSALVIAVYDGAGGGTRRTLEYALRQGVPFVDIRPDAP